MDNIQCQREKEIEAASQKAALKEKEGWREAGNIARQKKDEAFEEANRAQMEAEALKLKAQQKEEQASHLRAHASTLEGQEAELRGKEMNAGKAPGLMDRMKAGWEGVKEKLSGAKEDAGHRADSAGATTSEKMAGMRETVGTKMEHLGETLVHKGQETRTQAQIDKEKALERKADLESQALAREQLREQQTSGGFKSSEAGNLYPTGTTGTTGTTGSTNFQQDYPAMGEQQPGKTTWKESAAATGEKTAAFVGDKARDLQAKAHDTRIDVEKNK